MKEPEQINFIELTKDIYATDKSNALFLVPSGYRFAISAKSPVGNIYDMSIENAAKLLKNGEAKVVK